MEILYSDKDSRNTFTEAAFWQLQEFALQAGFKSYEYYSMDCTLEMMKVEKGDWLVVITNINSIAKLTLNEYLNSFGKPKGVYYYGIGNWYREEIILLESKEIYLI